MESYYFDLLIVALLLSFACYKWLYPRVLQCEKQSKLPPGPRGLPVVGNLFDVPTNKPWLEYIKWGERYGPISYAESLGVRIVVLNTYSAACDLLDKRSSIYSDRPSTTMLNELMGWGWLTTVRSYGERLRKHRWLLHKYLQPSTVKNYEHIQIQMTHRLLGHLLRSPEKFMTHIRNLSGSIMLMIAYGHDATSENDPFITIVDEALHWASKAQQPGTYFVDFIPWLKYFPDWLPGTNWKNDARVASALSQKMLHMPYNIMKEKILNGTVSSGILREILSDDGKLTDEDVAKEVMAMFYAAGTDTTVSVLYSAILAFILNPRVLDRAQKELDSVVGTHRLPTLEDRSDLPYLDAIVREVLRWNPVVPIGVPHMNSADDIVDGYFIPSGTTIIPNQWAMLHDEKEYPNPLTFDPERWLDKNGMLLDESKAPLHPNNIVFGFGRRICPGRHFADNTVFIAIASIAATFNVGKYRDENGNFVDPIVNYGSGILSHPDPFKCSIIPRSTLSELLIRQAIQESI